MRIKILKKSKHELQAWTTVGNHYKTKRGDRRFGHTGKE